MSLFGRPKERSIEELQKIPCTCGHSFDAHCYYPSGDCAGRNCGCERYRPDETKVEKNDEHAHD